jgi:hypothetical protein
MKKITPMILTILILTLTACGSASNRTNRNSVSQSGSTTGQLPAATQLIIGTLKLDGTDQAVTARQAADLLPLWQTMKVLSESDTAAQQEKDALIAQIQETMTAGQIQAITDMKLTRADMFALVQEQGTGASSSSTGAQNSSSQNRNSSSNSSRRNSGQGGGGFFPGGGGPPEGGFTGGQGQNLTPQQIATAQASRQQRNGNSISPALINAVIAYLQKKAGA